MDVEAYFREVKDWHKIADGARSALAGRAPGGYREKLARHPGEDPDLAFSHGALRWAVSPSTEARLQWEALAAHTDDLRDRDDYVRKLWETIERGPNTNLRSLLDEKWGTLPSYRRYLFEWLLSRLNLSGSLPLWTGRRRARLLHPVLSAVAVGLAIVVVAHWGLSFSSGVGVLAATLAAVVLGRPVFGAPFSPYFQALIPRLGAAVAIGYLFLAAAPDLVRKISGWGRPAWVQWGLGLGLLVAVWVYTMLHIARRVHPTPRIRRLALRALNLVWLGLGYSAVLAAVAAPFLFSRSFLEGSGSGTVFVTFRSLFLTATIALSLGVILQLAWDEKPLTEPL